MCEYMVNFIHKLKHLPEKYMMNSVLENFTILQVSGCVDSRRAMGQLSMVDVRMSFDPSGLNCGGFAKVYFSEAYLV